MFLKHSEFSFHTFLCNLESTLNTKRLYLAKDFSNYTEVFTVKQLQELYGVVPQTEILSFLKTFFTFILDNDAIFLEVLLNYWQQLTNETIFDTFITTLPRYPLPSSFEFGLKCFDLSHPDQWLLVDTRVLSILGFEYLAEHLKVYSKIKQIFHLWSMQVIQHQL